MTDHAAFLAAVVAEPDDDLPRLQMADWLDEPGSHFDPARAEFIRVQCEIARITSELRDGDTPVAMSEQCGVDGCECKSRAALRLRERDLLGPSPCTRCHWHPGVKHWVGVQWEWSRGFPSRITLSWHDWQTHAAALLAACPIARAKDGCVRLTTVPEYQFREGPEQGSCRFPGRAWRQFRDIVNGPIDYPLPTHDPMMLCLLAAEWPGVQFELPAATRDASIDWSMFGSPRRMPELPEGAFAAP